MILYRLQMIFIRKKLVL